MKPEPDTPSILSIADKHSALTAGWIFNKPGLEDFWRDAFAAGAAAEREACVRLAEETKAPFTADLIRARGKT